jgi:hypothetical protein
VGSCYARALSKFFTVGFGCFEYRISGGEAAICFNHPAQLISDWLRGAACQEPRHTYYRGKNAHQFHFLLPLDFPFFLPTFAEVGLLAMCLALA